MGSVNHRAMLQEAIERHAKPDLQWSIDLFSRPPHAEHLAVRCDLAGAWAVATRRIHHDQIEDTPNLDGLLDWMEANVRAQID